MSLTKTFTNITKGGTSALSGMANYVENKIDKKRNEEFQDKLSAKPRKEFGGKVMTDKEVEKFNEEIQKYVEIAEQAKKFEEENTKKHKRKNKMNEKRNLQSTEEEKSKHEPTFLDKIKYTWNHYYASKHKDTALMHFGHNGGAEHDKFKMCKSKFEREYDKRYGSFFCIDNDNAKDIDMYYRMFDSMQDAINKNLPYYKFYIGVHGDEDDYLHIVYSMDNLKKLLGVFSGEFDGKTVIFVKSACFDGDENSKYNFDFEETIKIFSEMCPKTKIVIEDHIDKNTYHWTHERKYATNHFKFKYRIMENGVEREATKKEKNEYIGGSFADKKSYKPKKDIPYKFAISLLPTSILAFVSIIGVAVGKHLRQHCIQKRLQQQRQHSAQHNNIVINDNGNSETLRINTRRGTKKRPNSAQVNNNIRRVNNNEVQSVNIFNRNNINRI